ncbi:MAG TPA: PDZ domain-containing protein, partial [Rhodanobacteraceae bacterium]|nr:PDZ domain-containing protein [Rhodanobacteraceae bacterium]
MSARSSRQIPYCRVGVRAAAGIVLVLLAGCAQLRITPSGQPPGPAESLKPHFEAAAGQDPATIAKLRAAPAPAEPEVSQGTTTAGDEQALIGRGFVRIGNGYDATGGSGARDWAIAQGRSVGADKVLLYEPMPGSALVASYYVHYRLPFGARFRSLTADEERTLGAGGVQIGEVVRGTPAADANLQTGDFVLRFNGKAIANRAEFQQLLSENVGKRITLTINRGGVTMDRLVRLGALAAS